MVLAGHSGDHRQQEQTKAAGNGPELQLRDLGQVHQTKQAEVDGEHVGTHAAGGGHRLLHGSQVALVDEGGQVQLVIGAVGKGIGGLLNPAHIHGLGIPVHGLGNGVEGIGVVDAHHVMDGLADDGVEDHQNDQGDEGPQAAAHGVDLLLLIELLDLQIITLPVFAVLLLQFLHLTLQDVHLDHAALALQGEGEKHHLDHQGEQDQGQAIAAAETIKNLQQPRKGGEDNFHLCASKLHCLAVTARGRTRWISAYGRAGISEYGEGPKSPP